MRLIGGITRYGAILMAVVWLVACGANAAGSPRLLSSSMPAPFSRTPTTNSDLATLQARAAAMDPNAAISRIMAHMTLAQKIGQMQMVEFLGTEYTGDLNSMIAQSGAGALIIYDQTTPRTIAQMQQLLASVQANAQIPVMTALDQEGGNVNRLQPFYGPAPSASYMGQLGDPQYAEAQGALTAQRLASLGFNTDLAPVVDVSDGGNDIEGPRLWSTSPAVTAQLAGAFMQGLQHNGIAATLKHWPGIGSIKQDPHNTLPVVTHDLATLTNVDFAPFKDLLPQQPAMIMTTHVALPAIDPNMPAELSPLVVDGVLRQQLGYQGVIVTDALIMNGITDTYSVQEASILAILAGNDILETGWDAYSTQSIIQAIQDAVTNGRITPARIDESVRRILRLKWDYGMGLAQLLQLAGPRPSPSAAPTALPGTAAVGIGTADLRAPR